MEDQKPKTGGSPLFEIVNDRSRKSEDEKTREVLPGDLFRTQVEILRQPRRVIRHRNDPPPDPVSDNPWNPWKEGK